MKTYDWIVVGAGLAGSALSYELAKVGFSVLLLDQFAAPQNATRYSYGGIAYWSGTTELTQQICQEGIELHRTLSAELDGDTRFRELDLLLTVAPDRDPTQVAAVYANCAIPPTILSSDAACEIEPLLERGAIAAALHLPHGHISPEAVINAYQQAFLRLGGTIQLGQVTRFIKSRRQVNGVVTQVASYESGNVAICAGGMCRALLKTVDLPVRHYFTQAELVEARSTEVQMRSMVMPAELQRFKMEANAGRVETDALWDEPGHEITPPILDVGVVQFQDGTLRMGQISRTLTDPNAPVEAAQSEQAIRNEVGHVLPALKNLSGEWYCCLVAFSSDRLPLIGSLPNTEGIHLFSGFSNPFAILPPLARRFAHHISGQPDATIQQLSPNRFSQT
ncbi:MAG: FAD-binding oxidoreductase [Cyanobacteria bacterium RU_5_0]|nr:FAD-binding oxidoreductase [Cyanobacteria bacterium RU_5_0]